MGDSKVPTHPGPPAVLPPLDPGEDEWMQQTLPYGSSALRVYISQDTSYTQQHKHGTRRLPLTWKCRA